MCIVYICCVYGFSDLVGLVMLDMSDFDISLGITWFSLYYIEHNCNRKSVTLEIQGKESLG